MATEDAFTDEELAFGNSCGIEHSPQELRFGTRNRPERCRASKCGALDH